MADNRPTDASAGPDADGPSFASAAEATQFAMDLVNFSQELIKDTLVLLSKTAVSNVQRRRTVYEAAKPSNIYGYANVPFERYEAMYQFMLKLSAETFAYMFSCIYAAQDVRDRGIPAEDAVRERWIYGCFANDELEEALAEHICVVERLAKLQFTRPYAALRALHGLPTANGARHTCTNRNHAHKDYKTVVAALGGLLTLVPDFHVMKKGPNGVLTETPRKAPSLKQREAEFGATLVNLFEYSEFYLIAREVWLVLVRQPLALRIQVAESAELAERVVRGSPLFAPTRAHLLPYLVSALRFYAMRSTRCAPDEDPVLTDMLPLKTPFELTRTTVPAVAPRQQPTWSHQTLHLYSVAFVRFPGPQTIGAMTSLLELTDDQVKTALARIAEHVPTPADEVFADGVAQRSARARAMLEDDAMVNIQ